MDRIKKRLKPSDAHSFVSDFLSKGQNVKKSKKGTGKAVDLGEMVLDADEAEEAEAENEQPGQC